MFIDYSNLVIFTMSGYTSFGCKISHKAGTLGEIIVFLREKFIISADLFVDLP